MRKLYALRVRCGLSVAEVAKRCNLSVVDVMRTESGESDEYRGTIVDVLERLAPSRKLSSITDEVLSRVASQVQDKSEPRKPTVDERRDGWHSILQGCGVPRGYIAKVGQRYDVNRGVVSRALEDFWRNDDKRILLLCGPRGSGKSLACARFVFEACRALYGHDKHILPRDHPWYFTAWHLATWPTYDDKRGNSGTVPRISTFVKSWRYVAIDEVGLEPLHEGTRQIMRFVLSELYAHDVKAVIATQRHSGSCKERPGIRERYAAKHGKALAQGAFFAELYGDHVYERILETGTVVQVKDPRENFRLNTEGDKPSNA